MKKEIAEILEQSASAGWVVEPLARRILDAYGLPVTRSVWAKDRDEALAGAAELGYPLVVKVVSPEVVHKSDAGGVEVGVENADHLRKVYDRLASLPAFDGVLLDEPARGIELIVGAKEDPQFGTVVLVGIGGTSVEIYQDVAIRMAPLSPEDAQDALDALEGRELLEGFRGEEAVDRESLIDLLVRFSEMAHELGDRVESIDLNPVFCSPERAVVADARIMLAESK